MKKIFELILGYLSYQSAKPNPLMILKWTLNVK
jgi:hypothetical protein